MTVICPADFGDPFRCPTKQEYLEQLLTLLPRGRAWQSHESATSAIVDRFPDVAAECGELQCGDGQLGTPGLVIERTTMAAYWAAYAEVCEYFSQRACKLLDEFFCQTIDETEDWWADDYGFPDPCDPWDDLCEKVAALGGATCEYLTWAAARRGWTIDCRDCSSSDVAEVGCIFVGQGLELCADCDANTVIITIDVLNSPAFTEAPYRPGLAGNARAGCTVLCEPSPQQIECLIERIKPAHVDVIYRYDYSYKLRARNLTVGSPELGQPTLNQVALDTGDLVVGSPELGTPTLTENP